MHRFTNTTEHVPRRKRLSLKGNSICDKNSLSLKQNHLKANLHFMTPESFSLCTWLYDKVASGDTCNCSQGCWHTASRSSCRACQKVVKWRFTSLTTWPCGRCLWFLLIFLSDFPRQRVLSVLTSWHCLDSQHYSWCIFLQIHYAPHCFWVWISEGRRDGRFLSSSL